MIDDLSIDELRDLAHKQALVIEHLQRANRHYEMAIEEFEAAMVCYEAGEMMRNIAELPDLINKN